MKCNRCGESRLTVADVRACQGCQDGTRQQIADDIPGEQPLINIVAIGGLANRFKPEPADTAPMTASEVIQSVLDGENAEYVDTRVFMNAAPNDGNTDEAVQVMLGAAAARVKEAEDIAQTTRESLLTVATQRDESEANLKAEREAHETTRQELTAAADYSEKQSSALDTMLAANSDLKASLAAAEADAQKAKEALAGIEISKDAQAVIQLQEQLNHVNGQLAQAAAATEALQKHNAELQAQITAQPAAPTPNSQNPGTPAP